MQAILQKKGLDAALVYVAVLALGKLLEGSVSQESFLEINGTKLLTKLLGNCILHNINLIIKLKSFSYGAAHIKLVITFFKYPCRFLNLAEVIIGSHLLYGNLERKRPGLAGLQFLGLSVCQKNARGLG